MQYAVIDIGSNTVKCSVYDDRKICNFYSEQLGLIGKIKDGVLPSDTIIELVSTINRFKSETPNAQVFCFATESLRKISNLQDVCEIIKHECGISLDLISGEDEAILSYEGFKSSAPHISNALIVDMGGGSTEILKYDQNGVVALNSFKFGCLSLRKDYVCGKFPTDTELTDIKNRIISELAGFPWLKSTNTLCLIGGTGQAVGKLAVELGFSENICFPKSTFIKIFDYFSDLDVERIKLLEKYIPARVETIIPGMCAYKQIIEITNAKMIYVSSYGIREGYLYRKLKEGSK